MAVWLLLGQAAIAESPSQLSGPLLLPQTDPGSIELVGLSHIVTLRATEAGTIACGTQRYTIRNDGDQPTEIRLSLASDAIIHHLNVTQDGATVTLGSLLPATMDLALERDQSTQLVVTYETGTIPGHVLCWGWDLTPLERWGQVPPTRVVLRYPSSVTDEVLWETSPPYGKLFGNEFTWDLASPQLMEAIILAPATWDEIARSRTEDDAQALARLYLSISSDATALGLSGRMAYAAAIGELVTAVKRAPENTELRSMLADVYVARSEMQPDSRLVYLSLAIQQLEAVTPAEQTPAIRERLGELHLEAAFAAEDQGDPSLAREHLRAAENLLGEDLVEQRQESLAMRLALSLAEEGRLDQALDALQGKISPQTRDALLRYAPPFASVVTTVTMTSKMRISEQRFQLYAPTADETRQALAGLATLLDSRESVEAHLAVDGETALLTVKAVWPDLETLREISKQLTEALDQEQLLSAVVASPWHGTPETHAQERDLWRTSVHYEEIVDLQHLQTLWKNEESLAEWQAVEIEAALSPGTEPTFEELLARYALSQQRDIWRDIPLSSYWIIQVASDGDDDPQPVGRVAFGDVRRISATSIKYHRGRLVLAGLTGGAFAVVLLALAAGNSTTKQGLH
ncbi:MAG: hypothetical protein J7M15_06190 [Anaerolineae bacterium]|nr:hypothetical protein [Anaerolineae bacterium]